MSTPPNNNGIWGKILLALLVPLALGLIGYGALKSDVRHVQTEVDRRAPQAVVDAQFAEILRRLDRIERKLP